MDQGKPSSKEATRKGEAQRAEPATPTVTPGAVHYPSAPGESPWVRGSARSVRGHVCRQASVWQHLGLPEAESSSGIPSHLCPWECFFLSLVFTKRPCTCA